jgi:hypothetical protein
MKRGNLKTEVEDDHIVVRIEGSSLRAAYHLDRAGRRLLQSEAMAIDHEVPKDQRRDFEQVAWEAACTKARDLGWI